MPRGHDRALYIPPFDHRGSFQTSMFGWQRELSEVQTAEIAAAKRAIFADKLLSAMRFALGGHVEQPAGVA